MKENEYLNPLEGTTEAIKRFAEQFKPEIGYAQSIINSIPDVTKTLKLIAEALMPIQDISKRLLESLAPFTERMAEITKSVTKLSRPFNVMEKLADSQYVYWDYFDSDMMDFVLNTENTNKALRLYHNKEKFKSVNETINKCLNSKSVQPNKALFEQSINAFNNGDTDLAVVGVVATIDGALEVLSDNPKVTSIFKRAKALLDKIENADDEEILAKLENYDTSIIILTRTFEKTLETFTTNQYPFSGPEPKFLNRHWIMHGRSKRRKTKLDCIKLINFLYGIIILDELSKDDDTGE